MRLGLYLALCMLTVFSAAASEEDARAVALFGHIRCPSCETQSLRDSEGTLAEDMKTWIRAEIAAGKSDEEITAQVRRIYGESSLLAPSNAHWPLWGFPLILLSAGIATLTVRRLRKNSGG